MDLTFWVIQGVLLTPVLFLAASVGGDGPSRRSGPALSPPPEPFTPEQRARLLRLRTFVREARLGRGALQDDLGPVTDAKAHSRPFNRRQFLIAVGVLLILVGVLGVVRTGMAMDPQAPTGVARYLPGAIVSPAKYLSAVNGRSGAPTLDAVGALEQKQAMDRWEALALVGLAALLFAATSEDEGSVASDVAPFVLVAAFVFAALSFFELP